MARVLYGVSPIGLGHATRSMVVIEELRKRGAEVRVFSGGRAAEFIAAGGIPVDDIVADAGPKVRGLEMRSVSLWYTRAWLAQRGNVKRASSLMDAFAPDVVVGDEEFSGLTAAQGRGMRRVLISDELSLGFARGWLAGKLEARVGRWYDALQGSVDALVIPEVGSDSGNRQYVGPIVRKATQSGGETRRKYGLPEGALVLLSMSGSGIGRELGDLLASAARAGELGGATLAVTGNRGDRFLGSGVVDLGVVADNQNLVACADVVVSTAGKSTIDEAAAAGTPLVVVPIRHHAEQERNAAALGFGYEDLARVPQLVRDRIGKRGAPTIFDGEKGAADAILGWGAL